MKVTVVPAQVTTVEDRIAGPLGISQLLLLIAPVFIDSALYVCLLPFFHYAVYKIVIMVLVMAVCGLLAIRIKGKIVLLWLAVLVRYYFRPRYYLYDKRSLAGRESAKPAEVVEEAVEEQAVEVPQRLIPLNAAEMAEAMGIIENPAAGFSLFADKKGGLSVRIKQIEQEV